MNYEDFIAEVKKDPNTCPTTAYALNVNSKHIKAGKPVQNACMRHLNDLEQSYGDYPYKFSQKHANHVFTFFEKHLKHSKGEWAGKPIKLESWQHFILGSLMGWIDKETGNRRFSLAYIQVARKQGKSLISSGLMVYMFMIDNEKGAEVYAASIKRDTAKIVWTEAMRMIKASPILRKHVRVQESLNTMQYGNSILRALSADSGQDGLNIHAFSLDEAMLLKDSKMYDVLVSGMGSRRSPLGFIITTAGESKGGTSFAYELYEYGKQVLSKITDNENMFFYIAEMDNIKQIHNPDNWIMSNPNLGVTVSQDSLEQAYTRAVDGGEMDNFLIKHMNMWISRKEAYFPMDKWIEQDLDVLEGKECYLGVDLSSKLDLSSISAVFPLDNGEYAVLNHNFMPENSLHEKERIDKVPYSNWVEQGYLTLTTGDVVDVEFIFNYIVEMSEVYDIQNIGVDPWNATALMTMLINELGYDIHEVRQGYRTLSEPIKFTKALMLQGKFKHQNNPVLRWATANSVPKHDANENIVLDKAKSINRIDPIASTVSAMVSAMLHEYEDSLEKHITEDYQIW